MRIILFFLALITLTACKIDMTVNGSGNVKTDAGTFDCSTGNSGDCTQSYVTDVTQCPNYVAPVGTALPIIPPNCTVIVDSVTTCSGFANANQTIQNCIVDNGVQENFHAQADQGSHFGSWTGDVLGCSGQSTVTCNRWIDSGSAGTDAQINITANFEQEPAPQSATYTYDHQGHRASKTYNGVTTYFSYSDIDGQLLGEYQYKTIGGTGTLLPVREYIYLDGIQAAMNVWDNTDPVHPQKQIVYFATNQTGQPMVAWDSTGNPVYERQQTPFMESMGEYSAPGIEVNTRSIGLYDDRESGYLQNWNRSVDVGVGFISPDPSGQNGGINTYAYVGGNPVQYVDPNGLDYASISGYMPHSGMATQDSVDAMTTVLGIIVSLPVAPESEPVVACSVAAKSLPFLRQRYVSAVSDLKVTGDSLRLAGADTEQIARALHAERRAIGEEFKELTSPDKLAEIYDRNLERYGDKLGPSFEYLINKGKSFEKIIESAARTGGKDLGF